MGSLIESNDITYSTDSAEWHNKARVPVDPSTGSRVKTLTAEILSPILFPVLAGESPLATVNGENVSLVETLPIFADLRGRDSGPQYLHIGTHSPGYGIIENGRILAGLQDSLSHTPHDITTAGTLKDCRLFYASARPADGGLFQTANGETFLNFVVAFSSHDGSFAKSQYFSAKRPVCMNTILMGFTTAAQRQYVRHSRNAPARLDAADKAFRDLLTQQAAFVEVYDRLAATPVAHDTAMQAFTGYAWRKMGKPEKIATRSRNVIDDIFARYLHGKGNSGATAADVLNGYTEYYSTGAGAGNSKSDSFERALQADFGSAADVKMDFARHLAQPDGLAEMVHLGINGGMAAYAAGAQPVFLSGLERTRAAGTGYVERAAAPAPSGDSFAELLNSPLAR